MKEIFASRRKLTQLVMICCQHSGLPFRDRMTFFRHVYSCGHYFTELHCAEPVEHRAHSCNCAGYTCCQIRPRACEGDDIAVLVEVHISCSSTGSHLSEVECVIFPVSSVNDCKAASAYVSRLRVNYCECVTYSNSSVYSVAAVIEDILSGQVREGMS